MRVLKLAVSNVAEEDWQDVFARIQTAFRKSRYAELDPQNISFAAANPATTGFDDGSLKALRVSIAATCQIVPGIVNEESGEAADGNRRLSCVRYIQMNPTSRGDENIRYSARIVPLTPGDAQYVTSLIANFNQREISALDLSNAIHKLYRGLKMPMIEVAKTLGIPEQRARRLEPLQQLPPEVRDMLDPRVTAEEKRLLQMEGYEIAIKLKDRPAEQIELAQRLVASRLNPTPGESPITNNRLKDLIAAYPQVKVQARRRGYTAFRPDPTDKIPEIVEEAKKAAIKLRDVLCRSDVHMEKKGKQWRDELLASVTSARTCLAECETRIEAQERRGNIPE